jgi:acyl-CoA thioester hydrolase
MPALFDYPHTVAPDEIDGQGHANNVVYVQWMQDAALAHSAALGWPAKRYNDLGCGWVVRSHSIVYRQPALAADRIVVRTWVATMKRVTSARRFRILRLPEETLLAEAETLWAFVSYATGQPIRIPKEIATAFPLLQQTVPAQ